MPEKIELRVSQYRYYSEGSWSAWFYEVAPFIDGQLDTKSLMIGHLRDCLSIRQCLDELEKRGYRNERTIIPSDENYNTGLKVGVHLDHHSGMPMQVREASSEDLGKLAGLLIDNPFS